MDLFHKLLYKGGKTMLKTALLSIRKNIGRSLLLFLLMFLITNLIIAGLSIQSASQESMNQVRTSLGRDVTFSYSMQNMMKDREKGEALDQSIQDITTDMADQMKDLKYVESYNYTLSVGVSSDNIDPVEMTAEDSTSSINQNRDKIFDNIPKMLDENDFTVVGNTTMAHLSSFENENYVLTLGRLLTEEDIGTTNCVIETTLASDNDLSVGDTITFLSSDGEVEVTLTIVGIYTVETTEQMGNMMSNRQNPMNQIYADLSIAQKLNQNDTKISSATYYLDDPDHIDDFIKLAQSSTDIDFDTYTLDANDQIYQRSISSLESMGQFATLFLIVVIVAGSTILCLILVLTMRGRFYEYGVFLSLGQSKIKIVCQQFLEIFMIAIVAWTLSLGTGKMVSNVIGNMLESTQNNQSQMIMELSGDQQMSGDNNPMQDQGQNKMSLWDQTMHSPENQELDVSLTSTTIVYLAGITTCICIVSIILPSLYILRLSPREILGRRES